MTKNTSKPRGGHHLLRDHHIRESWNR